jgi:hypothetical protein
MTPTERLAALGLTPDRPLAWIRDCRDVALAESYDESLRLIDERIGADGVKEWRAIARTPEGDTALLSLLGLDRNPVGWMRWSSHGALHEAEWRGLATIFRDPRPDRRCFVVAKTPEGNARWHELAQASEEIFNALPVLDPEA